MHWEGLEHSWPMRKTEDEFKPAFLGLRFCMLEEGQSTTGQAETPYSSQRNRSLLPTGALLALDNLEKSR